MDFLEICQGGDCVRFWSEKPPKGLQSSEDVPIYRFPVPLGPAGLSVSPIGHRMVAENLASGVGGEGINLAARGIYM